MKIYFHKDYKNIYHIATEETGTGWWDACLLDIKNEYILKRITLLLQENFKSIVFKTELLFHSYIHLYSLMGIVQIWLFLFNQTLFLAQNRGSSSQ